MPAQRGLPNWQLFAIAVVIWSTTWHAILYQLKVNPPEAGVALRFALTDVAMVFAPEFARVRAVVLPSPLAAPAWSLSLAYLAIAGSVVAFACYLTLQQRIRAPQCQ